MIIKFSKRSLEKSKQYVSTCTCKETLWLQNSANYTEKEQKYKKKKLEKLTTVLTVWTQVLQICTVKYLPKQKPVVSNGEV